MKLSTDRVNELKPVLENEELSDSFKKAESVEDVQKIFSDKGIAVSKEEVEALMEEIAGNSAELSEESLDNVAGGLISLTAIALYGAAVVVTAGVCYVAGRIVGKKAKCG